MIDDDLLLLCRTLSLCRRLHLLDLSHTKHRKFVFLFLHHVEHATAMVLSFRIQAVCLLILDGLKFNLSQVGGAATSPQFQTNTSIKLWITFDLTK